MAAIRTITPAVVGSCLKSKKGQRAANPAQLKIKFLQQATEPTIELKEGGKRCVTESVDEWKHPHGLVPDLPVRQHGRDAGEGVDGVEEMVFEGPKSRGVHWNPETPGYVRYEDCEGEAEIL